MARFSALERLSGAWPVLDTCPQRKQGTGAFARSIDSVIACAMRVQSAVSGNPLDVRYDDECDLPMLLE